MLTTRLGRRKGDLSDRAKITGSIGVGADGVVPPRKDAPGTDVDLVHLLVGDGHLGEIPLWIE